MQETAAAIEEKRQREALTHQRVYAALGLSKNTYQRIGKRPLRLETCGKVARWLGAEPRAVLEWEGHWERLSPLGRVIAPAMLRLALSERALADAADVSPQLVGDAVWGTQRPKDERLQRLAVALDAPLVDLRRAAREMRKSYPTPTVVKRIRKAEGREGLVRRADRMRKAYLRRTTREERVRHAKEVAVPALRARWEAVTDAERAVWSYRHLDPKPAGMFGLCRVCLKLTHWRKATSEPLEFHGPCVARWQSESPEWGEWLAAVHAAKVRNRPTPRPPLPPYPVKRRLSSAELADYYAAGIEYLRFKLRGKRDLARYISQGAPMTIRALAVSLGLGNTPAQAERRFYERVERLFELLPDPEICSRDLAKKVRGLLYLRELLAEQDAA